MTATRSLTHRLRITRIIITFGSISHRSLCIIHRSGNLTNKRKHHIILYLIYRRSTPFHLLQPIYSFEIEHIRISTIQTSRFMSAVKIENQFIFSTHFSSTIIECGHFLIIAVHKVYFEALYSHFSIMTANIFHIPLERMITGPKNNTHIFGRRVIH